MVLLEGAFAMISMGLCVMWPTVASAWFARIEQVFGKLARRKHLAVFVVGITALLLRLAILPLIPIPTPFVPDDFSFLLASDTFAHGHLTNPTPAMWMHFESIHITMNPSYVSMYFPAEGLILAAGQVLFGHPWFGQLIVMALMCAAICWMLQAWLPPTWALLGGILAILRIGLFSYWINTYTGAGCVAALAGALVFGAFPRILRKPSVRDVLLLSLGIVTLIYSRPYEGFLLCLPVLFVMIRWMLSKKRPPGRVLFKLSAIPLACVTIAALWLGYYDQHAFGNPMTLPYTVDRNTYAISPYWIWQKARPEPAYRHKAMHDFYIDGEAKLVEQFHTPSGFLLQNLLKATTAIQFFAGISLLPALIMGRRVFFDKRTRFFVLSCLVWVPGMFIVVFLLPHYYAPFTAAFYLLGLQCLRHLRAWRPGQLRVGISMARFAVASCVVLAAIRVWADPLHIHYASWPGKTFWVLNWYGPGVFGQERDKVESSLERLPGQQLVIVRYAKDHDPIKEWVYNLADIDHSKVVWAREMDTRNNENLLRYYKDRKAWLVQPDMQPAAITPYELPSSVADRFVGQGQKTVQWSGQGQ